MAGQVAPLQTHAGVRCGQAHQLLPHLVGTYRYVTVNASNLTLNPLSPHDALRHHFTSLKTDLIFLQPRVLERKFP